MTDRFFFTKLFVQVYSSENLAACLVSPILDGNNYSFMDSLYGNCHEC